MTHYPILRITQKTTNQQIFDAAYAHLKAQGRRCVKAVGSGRERCQYRNEGRACAVGAFLTDRLAALFDKRTTKGASVKTLSRMADAPNWLFKRLDFMIALQAVHDSMFDGPAFQSRLAKRFADIAKIYDLQPPAP